MADNNPDVVLSVGADSSDVIVALQKSLAAITDFQRQVIEKEREILSVRKEISTVTEKEVVNLGRAIIEQYRIELAEIKLNLKERLQVATDLHNRLADLTTSQTRLEMSASEVSIRNTKDQVKVRLQALEAEAEKERLIISSRASAEKLLQDTLRDIRGKAAAQKLEQLDQEITQEKLWRETKIRAEETLQKELARIKKQNQPDQPGSLIPGSSLVSFGIGLRSAASGIPGLRALSSLALGGGIGGTAGLIGAATGAGIGEAIRGIRELVDLYDQLATKAYEVAQNHVYLEGAITKTKETFIAGLLPAMKQIQEQETKLADWFDGNQDKVGNTAGQFGRLAMSINATTASLLAFFGIKTPESLVSGAGNIAGRLANMMEYYRLGVPGGVPGAVFAGAMSNPVGAGVKSTDLVNPASARAAINSSLVGFNAVDMTQYNKKEEELNRLKDELKLRREQLDIQNQANDLQRDMNDLKVKEEETLNVMYKPLSQEVAFLTKKIDLQEQINQKSEQAAQLEVEKANAKVTGIRTKISATTIDPKKLAELKIQETEAELQASDKQLKADTLVDNNKINIHKLIIELLQAENKEAHTQLDFAVADLTVEQQKSAAIIGQARATKELNDQQRSGPGNAAVQSVLAGQWPNGVGDSRVPLSQDAIDILRRAAYQAGEGQINQGIQNAQSAINISQSNLSNTTDPAKIAQYREEIRKAKLDIQDMNQALLVNLKLQQAIADPGSGSWNNIQDKINKASEAIAGMQVPTKTTGDMLRKTLEMLTGQLSIFRSGIGAVGADLAHVGKLIFDIANVINKQDKKAGTITGGLKDIFGSAGSFISQGIPIFGAIASSVFSVVGAIGDLFTKAAKKMAADIDAATKAIVTSANQTGKLQDAIDQLNQQRIKAVNDLGSKKGGQGQLKTLLPQIDQELTSLLAKQKQIVDSFDKALRDLGTGDATAKLLDSFDQIDQKVREFINAAGESQDTYDKAFQYISASAGQLMTNLQKQITDLRNSWTQGAEDAQGNLITKDQDAIQKQVDLFQQMIKAVGWDKLSQDQKDAYTQLLGWLGQTNTLEQEMGTYEKQRADLTKQNNKQETADLKNIADLKQQIVDLNTNEAKQITAINNQGIAERQQTSQQSKAQQIADLQDASKKQLQALNDQLDAIQQARIDRQAAYQEQITQINDAEQLQIESNNNQILRIVNETARARDLYLQQMADLQNQANMVDWLKQEELDGIKAVEDAWTASLQRRLDAYNAFIDGVINASQRVGGPLGNVDNLVGLSLDKVAYRMKS